MDKEIQELLKILQQLAVLSGEMVQMQAGA